MILSLLKGRHFKTYWSPTPPSGSTNHAFSFISLSLLHHYSLPLWSLSFNCTPVTLKTGLLTSHPFMPGAQVLYHTELPGACHRSSSAFRSTFCPAFPQKTLPLAPACPLPGPQTWPVLSLLRSSLFTQEQPLILPACYEDSRLPHFLQSRGPFFILSLSSPRQCLLMLPYILILSLSPPVPSTKWQIPDSTNIQVPNIC